METDFLLALLSESDKLHKPFLALIEREPVTLSPFALVEVDMLWLSRKIFVSDYAAFQRDLGDLLEYYDIDVLPDKPAYHERAHALRHEYGLTYFDSLHAGVALHEGMALVSSDPIYSKVNGLKHAHPREWLSGR